MISGSSRSVALRESHAGLALGVVAVLGLVVAFGVRLVLVWGRASPYYFPDEYMYAALGRSFAHLSDPTVRGHSSHFVALLAPVLTAPGWVTGSPETGFRIVQAIGTVAMTLTAVPVYLLARRIGLSKGFGAGASALSLLVPDMMYAGFVTSEPFAYPLAIGASAAAVCALSAPTRRNQVVFLALAGLAVFDRLQFVILPLCFLAAVVLIGLSERSLRRMARGQALPLAVIVAGGLGAVFVLLMRGFGFYTTDAGHVQLGPLALVHGLEGNLTTLAYASGWVLVPGAIIGLALAVAQPRTRVERAMGAFTSVLTVGLLLESAMWGDNFTVQERYFYYLIPFIILCFGLYARRGFPFRRHHAVLALGLALLAVRMPLTNWAVPGLDDHAPFLLGVAALGSTFNGNVVDAAVAVMAAASVLAVAAAAAPWLARSRVVILVGLATAICTAGYAGAWRSDHMYSAQLIQSYGLSDRSWVDEAHVGPTTLLDGFGGPSDTDLQLFWNRSVQRVAILPDTTLGPDAMASDQVEIASDGTLLADRKPLRGGLLIDGYGSRVILQSARKLGSTADFVLWTTRKPARLRLYFEGLDADGTFLASGRITVWPSHGRLAGWLDFHATALPGQPLHLSIGGRRIDTPQIHLRICSAGPWTASYRASAWKYVAGRFVAGHATSPIYHPDASACDGPERRH